MSRAALLVALAAGCPTPPEDDTGMDTDTADTDTADDTDTDVEPTVLVEVANHVGLDGTFGVGVVDRDPDDPDSIWWAIPITPLAVDQVVEVELHPPTVPEADWWLHVGFIAEAEGERWRCIVRELLEAEGQAEVFRHVELGAVDCVVQPL